MLPPLIDKLRDRSNQAHLPAYVLRSNLFKKKLIKQYLESDQCSLISSVPPLPLIPVISFVKTKAGVKPELKFKYIWCWKRPKQSYIFVTKVGFKNLRSLSLFYF